MNKKSSSHLTTFSQLPASVAPALGQSCTVCLCVSILHTGRPGGRAVHIEGHCTPDQGWQHQDDRSNRCHTQCWNSTHTQRKWMQIICNTHYGHRCWIFNHLDNPAPSKNYKHPPFSLSQSHYNTFNTFSLHSFAFWCNEKLLFFSEAIH